MAKPGYIGRIPYSSNGLHRIHNIPYPHKGTEDMGLPTRDD